MNAPISTFRRRNDGVLELLPRLDPLQTAKRAEIAIAIMVLTVGAGAALVHNIAMAVLLLVGGTALLVPPLIGEYLALRARRRQFAAELTASNERAPLRILRGEAAGPSRVSGIAND